MSQVIYLSEVVAFFKKNRKRVLYSAIICFCLTTLLILCVTEPVYLAEASFRQSANKPEETSSLQNILQSMRISSEEPPAISVMQSKSLLKKAVKECGLQVETASERKIPFLLQREMGFLQKNNDIVFQKVQLEGESKEAFLIKPLSAETFEVIYAKGKKIGHLNSPIQLERSIWTLAVMPKKAMQFQVVSERKAIANLQRTLKIKPSRLDSHILLLKYRHPQRKAAMALLNSVMKHYQNYLQEEHEQLASEQICYLQKRRDELEADFDLALNAHVGYLQNSLSTDGYLGLSQEVEMLSEPKEMYASKKHQLDLEQKRWRGNPLEAMTEHPWKEGLAKQEQLSWHQAQILSEGAISEELEGIDLETAEKLHTQYCHGRDQINVQIDQLNSFGEKLLEPEFDISALSQVLTDEVSRGIIEKATQIALQLADRNNYSTKERKRLAESIQVQKTFLYQHLEKQKNILDLKLSQIEGKLHRLKETALALIKREKAGVDTKLLEIQNKMKELPEKWRLENQLKLKKELNLQILEGLAQLSESKIVNHHLFHVESKPLDAADAPLNIQSPHLLLFSSMGGIIGAFFFFFFILLRGIARGLPVSKEYLRDRKYRMIQKNAIEKLAVAIQSSSTIALVDYPHGQRLLGALKKIGRNPLLLQEKEMSFHHRDFPEKLSGHKTEHDCILLECDQPDGLNHLVDRFIIDVSGKTAEKLELFKREQVLCVCS